MVGKHNPANRSLSLRKECGRPFQKPGGPVNLAREAPTTMATTMVRSRQDQGILKDELKIIRGHSGGPVEKRMLVTRTIEFLFPIIIKEF